MTQQEERMLIKLKDMLDKKRITHSKGVMETAAELALIYGCNINKARIAGLLHDCAKCVEKAGILQLCTDFGIVLDEINRRQLSLLHAPLGAVFARKYFGVNDEEILEAIRYHTTGKENMNLLTKIIFLSDFIEPNRNFKGVRLIRETAKLNLDNAIIHAMNGTIKYIVENGKLLHPDTIKARNYIIMRKL